jgi:hypothetical protein
MARRDIRPDALALQPPNLSALGGPNFTLQDREVLSTWLAQDGWPRGTIDIVMLEGYLVALLAWPVRVHPGAWLPPIWGETGWKVPAKISSQGDYDRFIALVLGFLADLDRGLSARPPHFVPVLRVRLSAPATPTDARCLLLGTRLSQGVAAQHTRAGGSLGIRSIGRDPYRALRIGPVGERIFR